MYRPPPTAKSCGPFPFPLDDENVRDDVNVRVAELVSVGD
jgi:hypothetical protein